MLALGLAGLESVTSDPSLEWDSGGGVRGRGGEGGGYIHTHLLAITGTSSSRQLWWEFLPTCHPLIPTSTGRLTSCGRCLLTSLPTQRTVEVTYTEYDVQVHKMQCSVLIGLLLTVFYWQLGQETFECVYVQSPCVESDGHLVCPSCY